MKPSRSFLTRSVKTSVLALGALLFSVGCGGDTTNKALNNLQGQWPVTAGDAGAWGGEGDGGGYVPPTTTTPTTYPTTQWPVATGDAGANNGDTTGGDTTGSDAGSNGPGTGTGSGGGLGGLFGDGGIFNPGPTPTPSTPDAGTSTGGTSGTPDPHGPCSALNLVCFDAFDMWIHPECQTCNNGKGCQGCALTAY